MPIKPENRHRYPKNWPEIRASILDRAGHKCEQCKAPDREVIARGTDGNYMLHDGAVFDALTGESLGDARGSEYPYDRMTRVILTIAHLDQTPENNDAANLKALCQRCHFAHDRIDNSAKAKATRRAHTHDIFEAVR